MSRLEELESTLRAEADIVIEYAWSSKRLAPTIAGNKLIEVVVRDENGNQIHLKDKDVLNRIYRLEVKNQRLYEVAKAFSKVELNGIKKSGLKESLVYWMMFSCRVTEIARDDEYFLNKIDTRFIEAKKKNPAIALEGFSIPEDILDEISQVVYEELAYHFAISLVAAKRRIKNFLNNYGELKDNILVFGAYGRLYRSLLK